MTSKSRGICHYCRKARHMLSECPKKRRCPNCGTSFVKCMDVENNNEHEGLLLYCCTRNCKHFKWCKNFPDKKWQWHDDCESSGITNGGEPVEDFSHMLKTLAKLTEEKDLEISLNINMRKGKRV